MPCLSSLTIMSPVKFVVAMYSSVFADSAAVISLKSRAREANSSGPATSALSSRSPDVIALARARSEVRGRTTDTASVTIVPMPTNRVPLLKTMSSMRVAREVSSASALLATNSARCFATIASSSSPMLSASLTMYSKEDRMSTSAAPTPLCSRMERPASTVWVKLFIRSARSLTAAASSASPSASAVA